MEKREGSQERNRIRHKMERRVEFVRRNGYIDLLLGDWMTQ